MSDNQNNDGNSQDGGKSDGGKKEANALEWTITIVGFLIVLTTMGFLVYEIVTADNKNPRLRLTLGDPVADSTLVLVPIDVQNVGGDVASDAVVEVCAGPDTCATVSFKYIPRQAKRHGTLGFTAPLNGPLEGRVVSYRTP